MNLTEKDVREILKLLDESGYDELKLETDNFNLTLRQSAGASTQQESNPAPATAAPAGEAPTVAGATTTRFAGGGQVRDIFPPLPGTFYRAPSPGAEPFVDVGSTVKEDTVLGLVETMKLMNPVNAGCSGEVIEICAENGALIDAHDVLMRIRESRESS